MKTKEFISILNQIDYKSKTYFQINGINYNCNNLIYISNPFKSNKILLNSDIDNPVDINFILCKLSNHNQEYDFKILSGDGKEKYEFVELKIKKRPKETYIILKKD